MKNWTEIRERYMRDPLPVRLGGLAANLSRIKSFSANEASRETVESLIDESKMFIEWTAAQAEINTAAMMVDVQVQLAFGKFVGNASGLTLLNENRLPNNPGFGQNRFWNYLVC